MTILTSIVCALVVAAAIVVHSLLSDLRDARRSVIYLARRHRHLAATLAETLDILSKHFPLRNDKAHLDALRSEAEQID